MNAGKYPAVARPEPYRATGRAPGFDGDPLIEVMLKDPDGDGKRELRATRRIDFLDEWLAKGKIREYHFFAARKFQGDGELCQARCSSSGEFMMGGRRTTFSPSDAVLEAARRSSEARARLRTALVTLGPAGEIFAVAVLLNRSPLKDACRFVGWHDHSGAAALTLILWQLARFYGYA
jgi:hypothetical protein